MIRKLRRKFVLINMLLVSAVLLAVFVFLLAFTYRGLREQSVSALRLALRWEDEEFPFRIEIDLPPPEGHPEDEEAGGGRPDNRHVAMIPVFTVVVDGDGSILSSTMGGNVTISDSALEEAVSQVLASGAREGTISSPRLRFLAQEEGDGSLVIAFADRGWELESLVSLVGTALLVGAGALLCFFLVSLVLSGIALRPAERAWEQQRQFVADASHELKTPITVILANAGIVLAHPEQTVAQESKWIGFIQEEAVRMRSLVEDMLFLAKNDAARQPPQFVSLSMSEVTTGCLLLFEPVAFEAGVSLDSRIDPDITLQGDEEQLRRLVMILLDNAVKYAGEKGSVYLTLTRSAERARLSVTNSGDPIPPEHLPHLFERFYRSDSARSRDRGGYGLGLAIAQTIVQTHGGRLSVTSSAQHGTCFTALLPVTRRRGRLALPRPRAK